MIQLGQKYQDKITGFKGVATGYVKYITGCNQVLLSPPVTGEGAMQDSNWIDESRLVSLDAEVIALNTVATNPGFDKMAPKR